MQRLGHLPRAAMTAILVVGLAACGGRANGAASAETRGTTQATPATVGTDVPAATDAPSPAATLDLPDLSAVQADLDTIDGALAGDAGAASDEGSDK